MHAFKSAQYIKYAIFSGQKNIYNPPYDFMLYPMLYIYVPN